MAENTSSTARGFLLRVEVGRQALVTARLLQDDGTTQDYYIQDLDADPERFNERLSKLDLLRDAQNRAEPVEIEYSTDSSGARTIDSIARITRDSNAWATQIASVDGLVSDVQLFSDNRTGAVQEKADYAQVTVLKDDLSTIGLTLDMQVPERQVVDQQLQWVLAALNDGSILRFYYDGKTSVVYGVGSGNSAASFGGSGQVQSLDGFVESLSPTAPAGQSNQLALFRFTTAPAFSGSGNYVPLTSFSPATLNLLVMKNSPSYDLVDEGLRDNLRMQVSAFKINQLRTGGTGGNAPPAGTSQPKLAASAATGTTAAKPPSADQPAPDYYLASSVTLLAPLASASRPVWVKISRELLDFGPEKLPCTDGLPINDLTPRTLRDLQLPYPAAWSGWGCFNHGVYRFQFALTVAFEVFVDGERLCVHTSDDKATQFAHACLHGEHHVEVKLEGWTCAKEFVMDVYRIR